MNSFTSGRLDSLPLKKEVTDVLTLLVTVTMHNERIMRSPSAKLEDELVLAAIRQSAESSNRMEGVTVHPRRLEPLVAGQEPPSGHAEQQVWNYREALRWVHEKHASVRPAPGDLQQLHSLLRLGFKGASEWRSREAEEETAELCDAYRAFRGTDDFHTRFVAAAAFALDFDNLRPFRDDAPRSRLTRLLVLLALYKAGHGVPRYVSLERLMEATRVEYAAALKASSKGWKEGRHDPCPWVGYLTSIVQWAYWEFETAAHGFRARGTPDILALPGDWPDEPEEKPEPKPAGRPPGREDDMSTRIVVAIDGLTGRFTVTGIREACPGPGPDLVRLLLKRLKAEDLVRPTGVGRGAAWEKTEKWADWFRKHYGPKEGN